jgi:hypothetical protein
MKDKTVVAKQQNDNDLYSQLSKLSDAQLLQFSRLVDSNMTWSISHKTPVTILLSGSHDNSHTCLVLYLNAVNASSVAYFKDMTSGNVAPTAIPIPLRAISYLLETLHHLKAL